MQHNNKTDHKHIKSEPGEIILTRSRICVKYEMIS